MKEVVIHARAGQGAITTASILAQALFSEANMHMHFLTLVQQEWVHP